MKNCVIIFFILLAVGCKKPFSAAYEITDAELVSSGSDTCFLATISSNNFDKIEELAVVSYSTLIRGAASSLTNTNAVLNLTRNIARVVINDTLSIFGGDSIFLNRKTKYVEKIKTIKKPFDLEFDRFEHQFIYKDSILVSRLLYVNGDTIPYYESKYTYTNTQLDKVEMFYKPENKLIFQTLFTYNSKLNVKPWIYLYSDFFGLADHLLIFNFGVMPNKILTSMTATYFAEDGIEKLGEWKLAFSNYKISKDNYVLRVSSTGQRIESLPFLYQNTELKYQCKN